MVLYNNMHLEVIELNKKSIIGDVREIIESLIRDLDYELVDIEFKKEGSSKFLRIFLDKPEGITLDDCQIMSKAVSDELDKTDPIKESYYLEVSSPGLDRPLKNDKDLKRNINKDVEVKLYEPLDGKKLIQGSLIEFDKKTIKLQNEDESVENIPREKIALIRLAVKF
jgi:ribosome maturation factor RimP